MNLEMTIDASRDSDRSFPGWLSMHPGMASWDGDRSIPEWRSILPGMVIDEPRMTIADPLNCDRFIPGRRSMHT